MSLRGRALRSALAAGFLVTTVFGAGIAQGAHFSVYGLTTDNRLVKFSPADPSVLTLNVNYGGTPASGISATAYTNNDTDAATGTTLYDLDTTLDDLVIQSPPNDGTLARVADLGATTTLFAGFDIRTIDGTNTAYASLTRQVGSGATVANLYLVDLATGAVTDLGRVGGPKVLRNIAVA